MTSIARELSDLAGQWDVTEKLVVLTSANTRYQLCQPNPLRWFVGFGFSPIPSNLNASVFITTLQNDAFIGGFNLNFYNTNLELSYRQVGGLVQQAIYGGGGVAGSIVQVIEVLSVSGSFFA